MLAAVLLFAAALSPISCVGKKDAVKTRNASQGVLVTGKIKVVGNEPHTKLIIAAETGKEYAVQGQLAGLLRKEYQHRTVTLRGTIVKEPLGPGAPGVFEAEALVDTVRN